MKPNIKINQNNNDRNKETRGFKKSLVIIAMFLSFSIAPAMAQFSIGLHVNITPPSWAPLYANVDLVHYYYLPDLECYYDVWNHEFIYQDDGFWTFSLSLPPWYSDFDLANCFVVLLDYHVHEPWLHHHLYLSHYPRYYYRSFYDRGEYANRGDLRGFNENDRHEMFVHGSQAVSGNRIPRGPAMSAPSGRAVREERAQENRTAERSMTEHRTGGMSYETRRMNASQGVSREVRNSPSLRAPQRVTYYGRNIGRPVRVQRYMTRPMNSGQRRR